MTGKKTTWNYWPGVLRRKIGDVLREVDERKYRIKEVEALQAMGTMITKEADSMSAMRMRMMKADRAFGMDRTIFKKNGIAEETKHKRYREVVQPCFLHSCEWIMSSRKWIKRGLSLEWFRADQIRMARKRFAEGGGECIEWLTQHRIWSYNEKIFDKED